jgi:flagellar hook protein FlgE
MKRKRYCKDYQQSESCFQKHWRASKGVITMGISSALYSGVSGLNTNSTAMTVIGNNLANTGTIGFKGSRTVFSDLLSSSINGSGGTSQVGRGVNLSKVDNNFSQGTFQSTDSGTDVAIEGSGFFVLKRDGEDTTYYSRAGSFRFDEGGFLVNPEGLRVQGQQYGTDGLLLPGSPTNILVDAAGLQPAHVTTSLTLNTNLDASSKEIPAATAFNYTDSTTFNYSASTQIYDTLGNPHLITAYFRKEDEIGLVTPPTPPAYTVGTNGSVGTPEVGTVTFADLQIGQSVTIDGMTVTATGGVATAADIATAFSTATTSNNAAVTGSLASWTTSGLSGTNLTFTEGGAGTDVNFQTSVMSVGSVPNPGAANTWDWYWSSTDAAKNAIGQGGNPNNPAGSITFNSDGTINTGGKGIIAPADLTWGNGASTTTAGIALTFNTTQFNSDSVVISQSQDGYGAGNLTGVTIDAQGAVTASYSNGVQKKISNLVLGKFNAVNGLELSGNNMFIATAESGTPRVGLPGSELGKIFTSSLEQSNVDMGIQFVEMITVQRAFQANSKMITTVDQLLNEVINMKQ